MRGGGGAARRRSCFGRRPRSRSNLLVASFFFFFFTSFLVDYGCGSVSFDLDRLGFFSSLVGFDDLAADWVGDDLA